MMRCPIFICGLPGAGKSHFGHALAESLSIPFFDLDDVIEEKHGSPSEIITTSGENQFRLIESIELGHWIKTNCGVLALGGGTPCFNNQMNWITSTGISIYLNEELDVIADRMLDDLTKRPLIKGKTRAEIRYNLYALSQKRSGIYRRSQLHTGSKPAQTLDLYTNRLKLLTKM
jgi:shikimate kinase